MFNNQIPFQDPDLVGAEFCLGSALAVPTSAVVSGAGRALWLQRQTWSPRAACAVACRKPELQHPASLCVAAAFYSCSLPHFFLPSLSFLAAPDRMALSLSLCLRLTITPIPLKEGQGLANRWRACGVLLLWLSFPVVCPVPLPSAGCADCDNYLFVCPKVVLFFFRAGMLMFKQLR